MDVNSIRKSKLFHREKMQKLKAKDYLKVVIIAGVIIVPLLLGLVL